MNKIVFGLIMLILVGCENQSQSPVKIVERGKPRFEWDFSKKKTYIYSYYQIVKQQNEMVKDGVVSRSKVQMSGKLIVQVKENNLADLSFADIQMKIITLNEEGNPTDTMIQNLPNSIGQKNMKSNGRFNNPVEDELFKLLFPLPKQYLRDGETDKIPLEMSFNANGTVLFPKGENSLTFTGYNQLEGRKCAILKGVFDVSEFEIPTDLKGNYQFSSRGTATYYFDREKGCYVGVDLKMMMNTLIDSKADEKKKFDTYMNMIMNSNFKIRLDKIVE